MTFWDVEVFGGVPPTPKQMAGAPISEMISTGSGDETYATPVFGPVVLQTVDAGTLTMWAYGDGTPQWALHVMDCVWRVNFGTIDGAVSIEGLETRDDGTAVFARWTATPTDPPAWAERIEGLIE